MSFRPFSEPGDGAQYERFADDARYSIHITDPKSGATKLRYDFVFSPVDEGYKNKNTVISYGVGTEVGPIVAVGDARQNFTQTFQVAERKRRSLPRASAPSLLTPPPNVGNRVTPAYNDPRRARQFRARRRCRISTSTRVRRSTRCALARWSGPVIAMTASIPTFRESSIC